MWAASKRVSRGSHHGVRDCQGRRPSGEGVRWRHRRRGSPQATTGASVELTALLLVDGDKITSDAKDLAKIKVTAEVVRDERGPKIHILKFKNKTGYRKRQGHRQDLTRLKVTGIK
jgi:large subunit ribosomal protein L21